MELLLFGILELEINLALLLKVTFIIIFRRICINALYLDPQQVPIISGDINKSSTLLATGGELSGEDAKINFYDLRSHQAPIHQFIESHQDDITQLLFHPIYENQLVSGSMDGLINMYDLKDFDEEEAIQTVLKFDQSISKLGFFGNQAEFLFSSSHMEHLRLWNLQSGDCISDFCDLKGYNFDNQFRMDYFINGHFDSLNERLFISGGDNSGRIGLIHVNLNSLQLCDVLDHGKEEIVRSVNWDQQVSLQILYLTFINFLFRVIN
jgi:WD40 repeat protein